MPMTDPVPILHWQIFQASEDGTATALEIAVLRGHSDDVNLVLFSPDGTRLASASIDRTVRLWHGQTGAEIVVLQRHSDKITDVVFSPDGTRLASSSEDGIVRLWDTQKGAEIAILRGHSLWVKSVAFSWDGTRFSSALSKQGLKLLSFETTQMRSTPWCFHWMAKDLPQHLMTEPCDSGMLKQAPKRRNTLDLDLLTSPWTAQNCY